MIQIRRAACASAALILTAGYMAAQPAPERTPRPYIRAAGDATASAKPDRARLDFGVVTQAPKAGTAAAQNASETASMLAALRQSLGSAAELRTSGYSLTPNFTYPKPGGQPVLTGYTASNTIEITAGDLANLGKVIDAATQAGANNVRGLEFLLKDEEPVRAQALGEAVAKARRSAEAMAGALGVKIVRVLSVEEGAPEVVRPMRSMAMAAAPVSTPVESGNIQVRASVTLTVEIAQ